MKDIELPPMVGVLHALPDHIKTAIEAYGAACARMATKEVKHQAPGLCQGTNCGVFAGEDHSPECILEAAESQGWSNSPEAEAARAAVEADRAQRVPDGWKLVPVEPTDEMEMAWDDAHGDGAPFHSMYAAMLASTPAPAQQERKPMTEEQAVKCIEAAGFKTWTSAHFRLVRQAERHHGIKE